MKKLSLFLSLFVSINLSAQTPVGLPTCTGYDAGLIYFTFQNQIYNYDPALPISATNPWPNTIGGPIVAGGSIVVGKNIYAATPSVTFYDQSGINFYWHNGTSWVNSGFGPGNFPSGSYATGLTSSGNFLYTMADSSATGPAEIFKNTGVGNGTFLTNVQGLTIANSPSSLVGDASGDFFILNSPSTNGSLYEYNSSGNLISSWTASIPVNANFASAYIGIIGTSVYLNSYEYNGNVVIRDIWKGTLSGTNFNFTLIDTTSITPFAYTECMSTCPSSNALEPLPASVSNMKARDFKLFPNPANNELTIVTENHSYNSFAITDIKGSIMTEGQMNNIQTNINIKILAPGNYFIKLMGEGGTNVQQFVKN